MLVFFIGITFTGIIYPGGSTIYCNIKFPLRQHQAIKQRGRPVRVAKRRSTTTRGTTLTTRRLAQASVTVRGNNVKSGVRKPVQTQKKPQTNATVQS
jgi:hypothetical protein